VTEDYGEKFLGTSLGSPAYLQLACHHRAHEEETATRWYDLVCALKKKNIGRNAHLMYSTLEGYFLL